MLLALLAMLSTLVEPAANVLHGMEHAAEAARHHESLVAFAPAERASNANVGSSAAVEETDHDAEFHATLHSAASTDLSGSAQIVAIAGAPTVFFASAIRMVRGRIVTRDAHPPDYGLRSVDLARAPPLN
jgi:hypothetical protein